MTGSLEKKGLFGGMNRIGEKEGGKGERKKEKKNRRGQSLLDGIISSALSDEGGWLDRRAEREKSTSMLGGERNNLKKTPPQQPIFSIEILSMYLERSIP